METDIQALVQQQAKQIEELQRILAQQSRKILRLETRLKKTAPERLKTKITRAKLSRLVRDKKTTEAIAKKFGVSERTVYRYIKKFKLKGVRVKGRRPSLREKIPRRGRWISVQTYINNLNRKYRFVNVNYPRSRFINPKTLVCSNERKNPEGKFTTVGVYYVLKQSNVYFLYLTRIKYGPEPVEFEEIYRWISSNAFDIVSNLWAETDAEVERVVAYTFLNPQLKPERVSNLDKGEEDG